MDGHIFADRVLQEPVWPAYAAASQSGLLPAQPPDSAVTKSVRCETGQQVRYSQGSNCQAVHR